MSPKWCSPGSSCRDLGPHAPGGKAQQAIMKSDNDEDWKAAEKALEKACRLPVGRDRIEALKQAGRLRFYAHNKRLAQNAKQDAPNELLETDPEGGPTLSCGSRRRA
jgi:hypothetical protein